MFKRPVQPDVPGNTPAPLAVGDMLYSANGTTWTQLGIGGAAEVLTVAAGVPDWLPNDAISPTIFSAANQLITSSANDTPALLAAPATDEVLTESGGSLDWRKLVNANIDAAAAIAYSKLSLGGSIVNADIAASAAIALSKLAVRVPYVYAKDNTARSNLNSATETTFFSQSIAAGDLHASDSMRLTLIGDQVANSVGQVKDLTLRVKLGATTIWQETVSYTVDSATRSPFFFQFTLSALGATNSQAWIGMYNLANGGGGTAPTTGEGANTLSTANSWRTWFNTSALDMTSAQTLAVTLQWNINNSTREVKTYAGILEILPSGA